MVWGVTTLLMLAGLAGCFRSPGPIINEVLDQQIRQGGGVLLTETARIQLINNTELNIELTVLVDGSEVIIPCSALEGSCSFTPSQCPQRIEAVEERRLTAQGQYTGGRLFDGNPAFTFDSTEFDCQSVITFTFTEDNTTAQVL